MTAVVGTALGGSLRYELLMAARGKVLWIAILPLLAVAVLFAITFPAMHGIASTSGQVAAGAQIVNLLATLGIAVALADRFTRTRRRGLPDLLDATGASPTLRMAGTLLGALAAALSPVAVAMLGLGGYLAISRHDRPHLAGPHSRSASSSSRPRCSPRPSPPPWDCCCPCRWPGFWSS